MRPNSPIKETSESNLLIYLEKMEEIHCGQTTLHEDGGVETSKEEIPRIIAYCQTTVEQHISILQNIKAVIE
ncbi:hypothetical protein [Dyadobacter sp. LHD-138]|uniref:hypothetical protein n=1 Tax=Dyadobacter sp. LHD-138 TaxID=3071413 RepID=UPI0027E0321F|nr:hypothetical protein [Dyadobacter sp. LHD-138]MDQ6482409.1 hypothetical protein [Dyadobacter sp. LHD-138]